MVLRDIEDPSIEVRRDARQMAELYRENFSEHQEAIRRTKDIMDARQNLEADELREKYNARGATEDEIEGAMTEQKISDEMSGQK